MAFQKTEFNQDFTTKQQYVDQFKALGFDAHKVEICYTNGMSVYVSLSAKVLDENKIYADLNVFDQMTSFKVRISDHASNLETICGGVTSSKISMRAFMHLQSNGIIEQL